METTETKPLLNTKLLMAASALFLGLLGIGASFVPQVILSHFGAPIEGLPVVLVEVTGALYLGFAILNWMARDKAIGGIYSRPVALGNFFHFVLVAVVLLEELIRGQTGTAFVVGTGAYVVFAACFGYLVFGVGDSCG